MRVLLTLAVVIVITMARTAPSTAWHSGIRPVVVIIILVDSLIPIQWANPQEVARFLWLAAWRLKCCPEIIATVPREMLTGALYLPRAGFLRTGAINLIPEGKGVVQLPIVYLVTGFVKQLPYS